MVEDGDEWAKQPYHAAEGRPSTEARLLIERAVESAKRIATRRIEELLKVQRESDQSIIGCGIVAPEPMPGWSTDEILAVHFRMHKAEGVLFPYALGYAAKSKRLKVWEFPEKQLMEIATAKLGGPVVKEVLEMGKTIGAPWGKDQKLAAVAAMLAFQS